MISTIRKTAACNYFGVHPVKIDLKRNLHGTRSNGKQPTYVIVGAGSAGCVLANRFSKDPDSTVLLIESGPPDQWWNWKIHMPGALVKNLCDTKFNWFYETEPEPQLNHRKIYWPRGKVWGGSSALNVMIYMRGHPLDYDRWAQEEGAPGWSYASCLPYFKKAQNHSLGGNAYRGDSGPLYVTRQSFNGILSSAWINAGIQAGHGFTEDPNGFRQEGFCPIDLTIFKGKRWSTSQAYLRPALKRSNLKVLSKANVTRIVFDELRAVGLEVQIGKSKQTILADKDIILCGGAINSPQLLLLSGVGDADELKKLDIPAVHHLPGVGLNLQDHLGVALQYSLRKPVSLCDQFSWKFPHKILFNGARWFFSHSGKAATTQFEVGGFVRSSSKLKHPDIQLQLLPFTVDDTGSVGGRQHAIQVHSQQLRPTSKGSLRLRSKNPRDYPLIYANYLTTEYDWKVWRACFETVRNLFVQNSFLPLIKEEILPGKSIQSVGLEEFLRANAGTSSHPCGTCKMGSANSRNAVIDATTLKVHGLEGIRVIDASIMPSLPSGNLNAPIIMMAERGADIILNKPMLPPEKVLFWLPNPY